MSSNNFRKSISADKSDFDKTDIIVGFSLDEIKRRARKEEYEDTILPLVNGNANEKQKTRDALEDKSRYIIQEWFKQKSELVEKEILRITKLHSGNYGKGCEYRLIYPSENECLKLSDYFNFEYSKSSIDLKFSMMLHFGIIDADEATIIRYANLRVVGSRRNRLSFIRVIILDFLHDYWEGFHISFSRDSRDNFIRFRWRI